MNDSTLNTLELILKMYYTGLDLTSENVSIIDINGLPTWVELCKVGASPRSHAGRARDGAHLAGQLQP